jgi:penicillin amidase
VHPAPAQPDPALLALPAQAAALFDALPQYHASNNWVVGGSRSATGKPLLANDPHLGHGLPGIWHELHVHTPTQDVAGVTIPGLPFVAIGHNRRIAWGFTNVMLDAGDFFREKVDLEKGQVMSRGEWVPLTVRDEVIRVKGGADVPLKVRSTPHGPLVSELLTGQAEALSYRWTYHAADHANEIEGFRALDRASDFREFRAALSRFGAVAQNVVYADVEGHIGLQTAGAIPRLLGQTEGNRFRVGWDGSEEWDGFLPFEDNPSTYDPPQGFLASANNPTVPAGFPHYISYHWEPLDRILRIDEVLRGNPRVSVEDVKALQADVLLVSAREIVPLLREAFAAQPPADPRLREALGLLAAWDFRMTTDSPAASVFAAFYGRLFEATFGDEMGPELCAAWQARGTVSSVMLRRVLQEGPARWFDREGTPQVEDRAAILRMALAEAVEGIRQQLPGPPHAWAWGRLHTLELTHPFARVSPAAAAYFDLGPLPLPGHTSTVAKAEFEEGAGYRVKVGPSMRQITDLADPGHALSVIPAGQSGIPASPHYADQWALWHAFLYHPLLMDRAAIDAVAEGTLTLAQR